MKQVSIRRQTHPRRGATFVLVLVIIPVLMGMAALTIDTGRLMCTRAALQNAADAAALAAAQSLDGTDLMGSMQAAEASAVAIIARNPIWSGQSATGSQIVFGQARKGIDGTTIDFLPNASPPNAVEVTVHYDMEYTFAQLLGLQSSYVSAGATSAIGARDVMFVLDVSCTMGELSDNAEIAADLTALGEAFVDSDSGVDGNGNGDSDDSDFGDDIKVTLCHIPKGNVSKAKTIHVDTGKVNKHLNHGDTLGPCVSSLTGCLGLDDSGD